MTTPGLVKADPASLDHWIWLAEYLDAQHQRQLLIDDLLAKHPGDEYGRARLTFALTYAPGGITGQEGSAILSTAHPEGVSLEMHSLPRRTPGFVDVFGAWHPHHEADQAWLFHAAAAWGFETARFLFDHDPKNSATS